MPNSIYLTVVIPVRNEETCIGETLRALADQDYPKDRYELLVVDGRSTDGTGRVVERFIRERPDVNLRLLDNSGRLSSRARNIGVRAARGELIAVIDAHVHIPRADLFSKMEQLREESGALCLARPAPLMSPGLDERMPLWIALARKSWMGHSRKSYIYSDAVGFVDPISSGFAYDRRVFGRVGYFDERFDAAEDVEFHYRLKQAGIAAYTAPELTIYSYPRKTLRALLRQMTRYGIGRARFLKKYPEAFTKETLIPPAVLVLSGALPLLAALSWWVPVAGLPCGAAAAAYCLPVLATGYASAPSKGRLVAGAMIALAIWLSHVGLGWGLLKTALVPRPPATGKPGREGSFGIRAPAEESV